MSFFCTLSSIMPSHKFALNISNSQTLGCLRWIQSLYICEFKWWRHMAWHHLSVIHFSIAVSHSSFWVLSKAKCVARGCLHLQTVSFVLLLHLLDAKSVLQTPRFQFSSQFTVITAAPSLPAVMVTELWKNKLRNMRHGGWQTHGHIVTETDEENAEWFDTTDSDFPILTSSMQAIKKDMRQKLCGTQQVEKNKISSICKAFSSRVEVLAGHRFYCLEANPCTLGSRTVIPSSVAEIRLVHCTNKINESTSWHKLFRV